MQGKWSRKLGHHAGTQVWGCASQAAHAEQGSADREQAAPGVAVRTKNLAGDYRSLDEGGLCSDVNRRRFA